MTPLTVIIPFFDETAYLRTALNSVLSQRIDGLQIIVVNDNPGVYSAADLVDLGVSDPIELIQHPRNLGLSAARNSGMKQARGRFIGFLDADDYYTLGGLAAQLRQACDTGADMTHAPTYFTRKGNPRVRILPRDETFFSTLKTARGLGDAEEAQFITSSWSSLYDRQFLTDNDLTFDAEQTRFEDRLFVLQTVTRARKIAFVGTPSRIWRGREGSISVTTSTPQTHLLQVQLLEKCMAHIRTEVASGALPRRFEKRELFNTVSRLIWDLDVVEAIVQQDEPIYGDLARRIPALLGNDSFGQAIFDDKTLQPVNRVGMKTGKGRVTRTKFFAIHSALRAGDFGQAQGLLADCRPATATQNRARAQSQPRASGPRLVLHLGLHKTGSTYIQNQLQAHAPALREVGILVPQTGLVSPDMPVRPGANQGHFGLITALRRNDPAPWRALKREIRQSKAKTVLLSCENMSFPIQPDRDLWINALADNLGGFSQVDLVALVRRPDAYVETFYRERIANGGSSGTGGIDAFLVDHCASLTDFPALFAPFEQRLATKVRLADFDRLRDTGLWPGFAELAGLPDGFASLDIPHYPTPDRETILLVQLLNTLVPQTGARTRLLQALFSLRSVPATDDFSLLSPQQRLEILDRWQEKSAAFAATRGYKPDLASARTELANEPWSAASTVAVEHLNDLIGLAHQATGDATASAPLPGHNQQGVSDMSVTIRLRPWLANLLRRARGQTG